MARYAWTVLVLNVGVVLLGAFVRATGSGAGCGRSWPTCDGQLIPTEAEGAQAIEFAHRATSGLALLAVGVLVVWVFRSTRGPARTAVAWSGAAILSEAAIGAVLVLAEWVADDASVARAVAVPAHLVNTFVLLGALTLTAWLLSGGTPIDRRQTAFRSHAWAAAGLLVIGATGAVTALADTLFPVASVAEGLRADLDSSASFLTRLRVIHPVVAIVVGGFVAQLGFRYAMRNPAGTTARFGLAVAGIVVLQVFAGIANVALLTPVWMQLVHLLIADALWVAFVLFTAARFGRQEPSSSLSASGVSTGRSHTNERQT